MNKSLLIAYRNVVILGVITLALTIILGSFQKGASLGSGIIIGLVPFISWDFLTGFVIKRKKSVCVVISLGKLFLLMAVLYLLFRTTWLMRVPFVMGLLLIQPIMIISVLKGAGNL